MMAPPVHRQIGFVSHDRPRSQLRRKTFSSMPSRPLPAGHEKLALFFAGAETVLLCHNSLSHQHLPLRGPPVNWLCLYNRPSAHSDPSAQIGFVLHE